MNFKGRMRKKAGITLISLVVTIIALLILAGVTIATLTGDSGILTQAKEAKMKTELAEYKEQVELYKREKRIENSKFIETSLTAGKESLLYNTQKTGETGNIKTIIKSISKEYLEKLEVVKGKLTIKTKNEEEIKVAQNLEIGVNPYEITEDGELVSSNGNLLLMDKETGTLTIPDTITKIGEGAFANLEGLKTIIIPGNVKRIEKNAFVNNKDLETVIMQEGVEYIGEGAFKGCPNLKNVEMPNSVTEIKSLAFMLDSNLNNIKLSTNLKRIEGYIFLSCIRLNNIEIPEGVTDINSYAFVNCTNLEKIKIASTVKTIEGTAFNGCAKLQDIEIAEGNNNFKFENGILLGKNKTEMIIILESAIKENKLTIPNTVTKLLGGQINQYTQITILEIPASVTEIGGGFITDYITKVTIESSNPKYETDGKAIYSKNTDYRELIKYYANEDKVTVKEGTKNIKTYAFNNRKLNVIELPETLEKIEGQAFNNCGNLKSLSLGLNVNSFNSMSIYNSGIATIEFIKDENGKTNPNYMIKKAKCNGKEEDALFNEDGTIFISPIKPLGTIITYEIPENTKGIEANAFHNQYNMTNITLSNTIKNIKPHGDVFMEIKLLYGKNKKHKQFHSKEK